MDTRELAQIGFWTVDEARRVLRGRRRGESLAVFARRIGTSASRISYWSRKLRAAGGSPATPRSRPARRGIELVPVTVVPLRPAVISIELRNGRVVRVEGDVDELVLERVIAVVERAGC